MGISLWRGVCGEEVQEAFGYFGFDRLRRGGGEEVGTSLWRGVCGGISLWQGGVRLRWLRPTERGGWKLVYAFWWAMGETEREKGKASDGEGEAGREAGREGGR